MLETVKYILDYFFNWGNDSGAFFHFCMLAVLCSFLGGPTKVSVFENGNDK